MKHLELSERQRELLLKTLEIYISTGAPVGSHALSEELEASSSTIRSELAHLESLGLLERRPDPTDRRGVLIKLSRQGLRVIDRAIPAVTRSESVFVSESIASADERRHVEAGLRQLLLAQETR